MKYLIKNLTKTVWHINIFNRFNLLELLLKNHLSQMEITVNFECFILFMFYLLHKHFE